MMVCSREPSEMTVSGEKRAPGAHVLVGEPTVVPGGLHGRSVSLTPGSCSTI